MLAGLALTVTLAAAHTAPPSSYLDAVRAYGPGTEAQAVLALDALGLTDADLVFHALDDSVCRSVGARSCGPGHLRMINQQAYARLIRQWRALYPRALALHIEALAACDPTTDRKPMDLHRQIVLRLLARLETLGREPYAIDSLRLLPGLGRRLLLWTLQYLRDIDGLGKALDAIEPGAGADLDVALARAAHAELRTLPDAVREGLETRGLDTPLPRDTQFTQEQARRLEVAAKIYDDVLASRPDVLEAHLRRARVLLRLGKAEPAAAHLKRVAALQPDPRQRYLAALFAADALERLDRRDEALQAYAAALHAWPGSQSPVIGLARLHALAGDAAAARGALQALAHERPADAPERTDPWVGYLGAQAWRLPAGLGELQAALPPLP